MKNSSGGFAMPGFIKFIKHAVKQDTKKSPTSLKQNGKVAAVEVLPQSCPEPQIQFFERSNFLIGNSIGQGSFALVYKGKERATGREVAMKVVRAQDQIEFDDGGAGCPDDAYRDVLDAMRIEANIIAGIGPHPNIVQLLGVTPDFTVLVMERGMIDIYCLLKKQPLVSLTMARRWMKHLLTAIDYLHELRIVHQDIKSSNVIIFPDHTAKLCDFGLARDVEGDMPVDRELVTLWYRPPELLMGATKYTERVDEWGAGCVALELVTGGSPFRGKPGHECTCPEQSHYNYNSDQLTKIFSVLGTPAPSCASWSLACAGHFAPWPRHTRVLEPRIAEACRRRRDMAEEEEVTARRAGAAASSSRRAPASAPVSPSRETQGRAAPAAVDEDESARRAERWAEEEEQWVELVASLLTYQPGRRMTARAALDLHLFSPLRPGRRLAISMAEGRSLVAEEAALPAFGRASSSPAGSGAGAAKHFASGAIGAPSGGRNAASAAAAASRYGVATSTAASAAATAAAEMRALDGLLEACRWQGAVVAPPEQSPRRLAPSPDDGAATATSTAATAPPAVRRDTSSTGTRPAPVSRLAVAATAVTAVGRLASRGAASGKVDKKVVGAAASGGPLADLGSGMLPALPAAAKAAPRAGAGVAAAGAEAPAPDVFFL